MLKLARKPKMRRRIPVIRISLRNGATIKQIENHPKFQKTVRDELIFAIEDGIKKKKKCIKLFQLDEYHYQELDRSQWPKALSHILRTYCEEENYSQCIRIRDLIKQI
jgi:hypothetical protein